MLKSALAGPNSRTSTFMWYSKKTNHFKMINNINSSMITYLGIITKFYKISEKSNDSWCIKSFMSSLCYWSKYNISNQWFYLIWCRFFRVIIEVIGNLKKTYSRNSIELIQLIRTGLLFQSLVISFFRLSLFIKPC